MHNLDDLVQEVRQVSLEDICIVNELLNLTDHKDGIDLDARCHDIEIALALVSLVANNYRTQLAKAHLE